MIFSLLQPDDKIDVGVCSADTPRDIVTCSRADVTRDDVIEESVSSDMDDSATAVDVRVCIPAAAVESAAV